MWEREIGDWLKAPRGQNGALDDTARGNAVWLYATAAKELVGVGSIGAARLKWPKPKSPELRASIIPMLGVSKNHQRRGFGKAILSDLVSVALESISERPLLILFVHESNPAYHFYLAHNLVEYGKPYRDPHTGHVNKRMVLDLSKAT